MNLADLGNTPLADAVDFDNLPAQGGSFAPPIAPGPYRFELTPLKDANFSKVVTNDYGDRVQVHFDAASPLKIVESPLNAHTGEPFETRISNVPRPRGKDKNLASDWDYLNRALKVAKRPTSNIDYAKQLMADSNATPAKSFAADAEWSWNCNPQRDAYFTAEDGSQQPIPDSNAPGKNIQGCGAKYYQGDKDRAADVAGKKAGAVAKRVEVEGAAPVFPLRIQCGCGATVRAFANLTRIRE